MQCAENIKYVLDMLKHFKNGQLCLQPPPQVANASYLDQNDCGQVCIAYLLYLEFQILLASTHSHFYILASTSNRLCVLASKI